MKPEKPSVVAVIPARYGSTRLPGKSLVPLCGKPLILWVLERVRQAPGLDAVLVATDDDRIRRVVEAAGGRVAMTRPDHPSGTDRIAEAVRDLPAAIVVNVQGDEPLIAPALIGRVADALVREPEWAMSTAATPIVSAEELRAPSVVKVVCDARGRALYFSRSPIPFVRDTSPAGLRHWRHLGIYGYRRDFLQRLVAEPPSLLEQAEKLEQLRALHLGAAIQVIETEAAGVGVDTPEDVPRAEAALRAAGLAG
jgi:3-deoxy-manno-octulosonate cytidylyltransferase (CMP-KDO synthetase)